MAKPEGEACTHMRSLSLWTYRYLGTGWLTNYWF